MGTNSFLEEIAVDGKQITELLPGDPWISTEAAYELLKLSSFFIRSPLHVIFRDLSFYLSVERILKRRYWACMTGIAPGNQQDEDIQGISVLDALMFFRERGIEAEEITSAIEYIWESIAAKQELDAKTNKGVLMLLEQAKEGNEIAKVAVDLLREAYQQRADS